MGVFSLGKKLKKKTREAKERESKKKKCQKEGDSNKGGWGLFQKSEMM